MRKRGGGGEGPGSMYGYKRFWEQTVTVNSGVSMLSHLRSLVVISIRYWFGRWVVAGIASDCVRLPPPPAGGSPP